MNKSTIGQALRDIAGCLASKDIPPDPKGHGLWLLELADAIEHGQDPVASEVDAASERLRAVGSLVTLACDRLEALTSTGPDLDIAPDDTAPDDIGSEAWLEWALRSINVHDDKVNWTAVAIEALVAAGVLDGAKMFVHRGWGEAPITKAGLVMIQAAHARATRERLDADAARGRDIGATPMRPADFVLVWRDGSPTGSITASGGAGGTLHPNPVPTEDTIDRRLADHDQAIVDRFCQQPLMGGDPPRPVPTEALLPTDADDLVVMVLDRKDDGGSSWEALREALNAEAEPCGYQISQWGPADVMRRSIAGTMVQQVLQRALDTVFEGGD